MLLKQTNEKRLSGGVGKAFFLWHIKGGKL